MEIISRIKRWIARKSFENIFNEILADEIIKNIEYMENVDKAFSNPNLPYLCQLITSKGESS